MPSIETTATPSISVTPTASSIPTVAPSSSPSQCTDDPNWFFDKDYSMGCAEINDYFKSEDGLCNQYRDIEYEGKLVNDACCVCGGGKHLSRQPSDEPTMSQAPSLTPSVSQQPSLTPSTIPSSTPSQSSLPSTFPSVTSGTVLDMDSCRNNADCKSAVCSDAEEPEGGLCEPGVSGPFNLSTKNILLNY